jgi:hypothetical protein
MNSVVKLNEVDFELIKEQLKDYLNRDGSPFKLYNMNAGALAGLIDFGAYVMHYLATYLNLTVSDLFMNSAVLEENIYALINNFNYIPRLKTPANAYLRILYDRDAITDVGDDSKIFQVYHNYVNYTSDYKVIPTFRDKYVESQYTTMNLATTDPNDENKAIFEIQPYVDGSGNRYLMALIPCYQAEWQSIELIVDNTFSQNLYLSTDGTINTDLYGDNVIEDTIRVFVKEGGTTWYEYTNMRIGNFDADDLRSFNISYDQNYGIYIKFNIDAFSKFIPSGDTIRVFFATTQGDDINELQGTRQFNSTAANLSDIGYLKIYDITDSTDIFELDAGTVITGTTSYLDVSIVESSSFSGSLTYLTNGIDKQSITSIKETAPLWYSTQGRAVSENDYNFILKKRYSEFADIRAWGGNREFIDLESLINNYTPGVGSLADEIRLGIQAIMGTKYNPNIYANEYLAIDTITQDDLNDGYYDRDVGYVYFSIFKNSFQFEDNTSTIDEVKAYLDKYKILTIYYKYMYPTYNILQPNISIGIAPAYLKTYDLREIKQRIKDYINEVGKTSANFYLSSLYSEINSYEEVNQVISVNYTLKAKVKNQSGTDWTYVRLYTYLDREINTLVEGNTFVTEEDSPGSLMGNIKINSSVVGRINYTTGLMKFQYDFGVDEYYINGITTSGNKVSSFKDCFFGVEFLNDITLTVE